MSGVNPFDCTKCDRILNRIGAPEPEKRFMFMGYRRLAHSKLKKIVN